MNWATLMDFLTLSRVRLLYDMAGAGILAYGGLTGKNRAGEAEVFWTSDTITSNIEAGRRETKVGLGLLIAGFMLQLSSGTLLEPFTSIGAFLTVALAAVITIYLYRHS